MIIVDDNPIAILTHEGWGCEFYSDGSGESFICLIDKRIKLTDSYMPRLKCRARSYINSYLLEN